MAEGLDRLPLTIGSLIGGCMVSVGLSAVVGIQTFIYFHVFPTDKLQYKSFVAWIWITDAAHTFSVCTVIWQYGVSNFNNPAKLLEIVPTYPVNLILTLIATLNANLFYTWRIHKMSKSNWWLTGPIVGFCFPDTFYDTIQFNAVRLVYREDRIGIMLMTKKWALMVADFQINVISGLAVSAATDIVISAARYYYLRDLKQGYMAKQEMVDAVVIFTINDGCLTCAAVIACIACYLSMPKSFVWMGIFIILAKLFANSILATLNLRNWYRHRHRPLGIPLTRHQRNNLKIGPSTDHMPDTPATMEVFIDQRVEYSVAVGKYKKDNSDEHSQS
ncbi:hypothetical protein B0H13DRAFT_2375440 [Mycena leptocephala]|nr:hypothetical protein B0H13DRAFT_2375440 [Mycena leptocephala]